MLLCLTLRRRKQSLQVPARVKRPGSNAAAPRPDGHPARRPDRPDHDRIRRDDGRCRAAPEPNEVAPRRRPTLVQRNSQLPPILLSKAQPTNQDEGSSNKCSLRMLIAEIPDLLQSLPGGGQISADKGESEQPDQKLETLLRSSFGLVEFLSAKIGPLGFLEDRRRELKRSVHSSHHLRVSKSDLITSESLPPSCA